MIAQYPVLITCRDRLRPLLQLVEWLERAGQHELYLIDNDSSYPPLLDYYDRCPYTVIRLGRNIGHVAAWETGLVNELCAGRYYVVTDPDIVPVDYCPTDALEHFREALDRYPSVSKVGFGLKIDDLPAQYRFADTVRAWEGQFWTKELEPGIYEAPIDTTLALYRPGAAHLVSSLRTGEPYVARHTPWYGNTAAPDPEERYYRAHTRPDLNHWDGDELPDRLIDMMRAAGVTPPTPMVAETPAAGPARGRAIARILRALRLPAR